MIECIFTIDYEIYGNGEGSLRELVFDPVEQLQETFGQRNERFVVFVEAAELEKIEEHKADEGISDVRRQIRQLHTQGVEIGLHLHPQWYNARYENEKWLLDYGEYNLCTLPRHRIEHVVGKGISYLRDVLGEPDFTPCSFRAGNWLLQPTETAAAVLAEAGVRIDSSVFKGGLQRNHRLDYRPALKNGYYWPFGDDVNVPAPDGALMEIPTHTVMAPFWKMLTGKRIGLQRKSLSSSQSSGSRFNRLLDYLRPWYPLKFDFCRMTLDELISMIDGVIREDRKSPATYRPLVAIGHSKDLLDFSAIELFLPYLKERNIRITTFRDVYPKCGASAPTGNY